MTQEFQSTKEFTVGDMFIDADGELICFIAKITQQAKGQQYHFHLEYFEKFAVMNRITRKRELCTLFMKDRIRFGGWKHIPVKR